MSDFSCKTCNNDPCQCNKECDKGKCLTCSCPHSLCRCKKKCPLKIVVIGLSLAVGPALGGYFIATSLKAPPSHDRFITVNIEVERETKADYVTWRLGFQNTGNDVKALQTKYEADRDAILNFLKEKGFKEEEISVGGPRIIDQFAREWGQADVQKLPDDARYILDSRIKVFTANVEGVEKAVKSTDALLREGVVLTERSWDANPRYFLKNQAKLEQDLYGEALEKANVLATQIAAGMKVSLKGLRQTEQIQPLKIMGQGQGDNYDSSVMRLKGPIKRAYLQMSAKYNID